METFDGPSFVTSAGDVTADSFREYWANVSLFVPDDSHFGVRNVILRFPMTSSSVPCRADDDVFRVGTGGVGRRTGGILSWPPHWRRATHQGRHAGEVK